MPKTKYYILISFLVLIFCCEKDTDVIYKYYPGKTGDLIGYVKLFNEFGQKQSPDSIDYSVKITAIGNFTSYTVNSDSEGIFRFENLPASTYDLIFEKENYGTVKRYSLIHLGGEPTILNNTYSYSSYTRNYFYIGEIPGTEFLYIDYNSNSGKLVCGFKFNKTPPQTLDYSNTYSLYIRLFVSKYENVSFENHEYTRSCIVTSRSGLNQAFEGYFYCEDLQEVGEYYMKLYIENYPVYSYDDDEYYFYTYTDIYTGNTIYPCLDISGSEVYNFTCLSMN